MKKPPHQHTHAHTTRKTWYQLLMLVTVFGLLPSCQETPPISATEPVIKTSSNKTPKQRYTAAQIYQFCREHHGNMQLAIDTFGKPDYDMRYGNNLRFRLIAYTDRVNNQIAMIYYNADEELTIELREGLQILPLSLPLECLDQVQRG